MNGNSTLNPVSVISQTSHSLGKQLEWKPLFDDGAVSDSLPSHSLGKQLEWKLIGLGGIPLGYVRLPTPGETRK